MEGFIPTIEIQYRPGEPKIEFRVTMEDGKIYNLEAKWQGKIERPIDLEDDLMSAEHKFNSIPKDDTATNRLIIESAKEKISSNLQTEITNYINNEFSCSRSRIIAIRISNV